MHHRPSSNATPLIGKQHHCQAQLQLVGHVPHRRVYLRWEPNTYDFRRPRATLLKLHTPLHGLFGLEKY